MTYTVLRGTLNPTHLLVVTGVIELPDVQAVLFVFAICLYMSL